jgi:hypothetical protein
MSSSCGMETLVEIIVHEFVWWVSAKELPDLQS